MKRKILVILFLLSTFYFLLSTRVRAVNCDNPSSLDLISINDCLGKTNETLDLISKANQTNKGNLKNLQNQVAALKRQLDGLSFELEQKQTELNNRNQDFDSQYSQFSNRVRSFYETSYSVNPAAAILGGKNILEIIRLAHTYSFLSKRNKEMIANLVTSISDLQKEKDGLASALAQTSSLKTQVDKQAEFLAGEVAKANNYEQQLGTQIAALSARQQEIINSRSGNFTVSIGDSELADDYNASIKGFRESAPGGYFAVFSFGAYTHRNGMSQYGALGRFKSGKNTDAESILKFYYPNATLKKDYGAPSTITISGYGVRQFEDEYMKRIYEMPGSWPSEVLKAQAVAARTFALRYTNNGAGSICADEGCQVYRDQNKGGAWDSAASDTKSWVLVDGGGNLVSSQFSSTTGGWINGVGWDTNNGNGGSAFFNNSYEKLAGSPWAYKAWYTQGYDINSDKCGRSNPWLSPEEMADIVNAAIALRTGGIDTSRITPVSSCWGGNPYSMDELRNLVVGNGGLSSANSVSVSQGDGSTVNVTINGLSFGGAEFKKAFNLRAPGRLSIPQTGFAFFNIEKK